MIIATPFDKTNGKIFSHFGKSELFKVFTLEDNKIISSELVECEESGHNALAVSLVNNDVDLVICDGIGDGATDTLSAAGIEIISGAKGDPEEAIKAYLAGELTSSGVNCENNDSECCGCGSEEGCDCGDDESCSGCGGGCGGCGSRELTVIYDGKNAGKRVKTHYCGTLDDGTQFDSSYDRGEPLEFVCGCGMMIPGFDKAVVDMELGQTVNIHIEPEDAYGMPDPEAIITVEMAQMEGSSDLNVGQKVFLTNMYGQQFPVTVAAKDEVNITFDANHELAGKALNFKIELVEVED